jgi:hypothetical protein
VVVFEAIVAKAAKDIGEEKKDNYDNNYYPYPVKAASPESTSIIFCHTVHSFHNKSNLTKNMSTIIISWYAIYHIQKKIFVLQKTEAARKAASVPALLHFSGVSMLPGSF